MGGKCCTDRKEPQRGAARRRDGGEGGGHGKPAARGPGAGDSRKCSISIGYHSKGDDAEKFDKAFESNDIHAFVRLLSSQQGIESFEERMHPWAEDPRTVGALAGAQLAILASVAEREQPSMKEDMREAGVIPPLVDFLRSDQNDRVQTAVIALSFLTAECPSNSSAAYKAGALPLLLMHLGSKVAGMRTAAATTLRNICQSNHDAKKAFVESGGVAGLVGQLESDSLDSDSDPHINHADVQLEAVLNLQDMIEFEEGGVIEEYARAAIKAGAEEKLRKLAQSSHDEVRQSALELLDCLACVRR